MIWLESGRFLSTCISDCILHVIFVSMTLLTSGTKVLSSFLFLFTGTQAAAGKAYAGAFGFSPCKLTFSGPCTRHVPGTMKPEKVQSACSRSNFSFTSNLHAFSFSHVFLSCFLSNPLNMFSFKQDSLLFPLNKVLLIFCLLRKRIRS